MKRIWITGIIGILLLTMIIGFACAANGTKNPKPYYSGVAIEGATLQLFAENGELVKEWITTEEAFIINAELEPGGIYILHEKNAPVGYLPAEDITFMVSNDGSLDEIVMKDAPTEVNIEKKDKETSEYVYDAVLQLLNDKNEVIDEWTTNGTAHKLIGVLKAGATYTIHEKTVPKGYQQSKDEQFTVPLTEEPLNITYTNLKQKDDIPKTGDTNHLILYISVASGMILLISILLILKRKTTDNE